MATKNLYIVVTIDAAQIDGSTQDLHDTLREGSGRGVLTVEGMAFDVDLTRISQVGV